MRQLSGSPFILAVVTVVMLIPIGCGEDTVLPEQEFLTQEKLVIMNAKRVLSAVKGFAAHNDGLYPMDVDEDTNDEGLTLIEYLPRAFYLQNPYTGDFTEPHTGVVARPGEIGFKLLYGSIRTAYTVVGRGLNSTLIIYSNIPDLDAIVVTNTRIVQTAVEAFAAESGGLYPYNVDSDISQAGNTVIDLLPGGEYLENPYEPGTPREVPQNGYPGWGGVGYEVRNEGGVNVGYSITGSGERLRFVVTEEDYE